MLKLMKKIGQWLLKYSDYYVMAIALICLYAIFQIKFDFAFWMGYSEKAEAWNEIITNLSYSYLAGFIFYLLTVTLPHKKMKGKVKVALDSKLNTIRTNYKACVESVYHPLKAMSLDITREEAVANFKAVSFYQKCKKPWLSSETVAQIEKIRNSNLPAIIISLTQSIGKDQLDNEDGRGMLAGEVYDMWEVAKGIRF